MLVERDHIAQTTSIGRGHYQLRIRACVVTLLAPDTHLSGTKGPIITLGEAYREPSRRLSRNWGVGHEWEVQGAILRHTFVDTQRRVI